MVQAISHILHLVSDGLDQRFGSVRLEWSSVFHLHNVDMMIDARYLNPRLQHHYIVSRGAGSMKKYFRDLEFGE